MSPCRAGKRHCRTWGTPSPCSNHSSYRYSSNRQFSYTPLCSTSKGSGARSNACLGRSWFWLRQSSFYSVRHEAALLGPWCHRRIYAILRQNDAWRRGQQASWDSPEHGKLPAPSLPLFISTPAAIAARRLAYWRPSGPALVSSWPLVHYLTVLRWPIQPVG